MKPTHRLKFLNKVTEERGEVGDGWLNPDGSVSIVLNPFVTLTQSKDIDLRLFPVTERKGPPGEPT
jgi:hypothetical protein